MASARYSVILEPGLLGAVQRGRKRQLCVPMASPLAAAMPGDRIWVREACVPTRHEDGRDIATALARAEFAIFPDGWRQPRPDGSGHAEGWQGRPPADGDHVWLSAKQMPRWASRMLLTVTARRECRLQQLRPADIRAEGAMALLGGLLWRWPPPLPGLHLTAHRALAAWWDIAHPTPGERWADDPPIAIFAIKPAAGGGD